MRSQGFAPPHDHLPGPEIIDSSTAGVSPCAVLAGDDTEAIMLDFMQHSAPEGGFGAFIGSRAK
jgi:hypothetical protein